MKTKVLLIAISLLCSASIFSQDTPFRQWLDNPYIGSSFITKSMIEMAPDIKIIKAFEDMLDQVEIYTNKAGTSGEVTATEMMAKASGIANEKQYELLMKLNLDNRHIIFFAQKNEKNKELVKDLIMINSEIEGNDVTPENRGECVVIRLVGQFTLDELKDFMNSSSNR